MSCGGLSKKPHTLLHAVSGSGATFCGKARRGEDRRLGVREIYVFLKPQQKIAGSISDFHPRLDRRRPFMPSRMVRFASVSQAGVSCSGECGDCEEGPLPLGKILSWLLRLTGSSAQGTMAGLGLEFLAEMVARPPRWDQADVYFCACFFADKAGRISFLLSTHSTDS